MADFALSLTFSFIRHQLDKAERKRRKKEAKLAAAAGALDRKAAAEIGDASLVSTAIGDTTRADESMLNGESEGIDEAERKRLKKLRKEEKKAKKAQKGDA